MKPVVYKKELEKEILHSGEYLKHKFVILNLGMHPTAYIECKLEDCKGTSDERLDEIVVHGGFTWFGTAHWDKDDKTMYLGWDYGHYGDFAGYMTENDLFIDWNEKKWTTEEIYNEVKYVITQMVQLYAKLGGRR